MHHLRATSRLAAESSWTDDRIQLLDLGEIDDWADLVSRDGTILRFCARVIADVLRVSRYSERHEIRHAVRRQAQDFGAANWIGTSLTSMSGQTADRSEVEEALAERLIALKSN